MTEIDNSGFFHQKDKLMRQIMEEEDKKVLKKFKDFEDEVEHQEMMYLLRFLFLIISIAFVGTIAILCSFFFQIMFK